jgi:hypothetical protein
MRIPPEDPEEVRRRDDAYLERGVGDHWANDARIVPATAPSAEDEFLEDVDGDED